MTDKDPLTANESDGDAWQCAFAEYDESYNPETGDEWYWFTCQRPNEVPFDLRCTNCPRRDL